MKRVASSLFAVLLGHLLILSAPRPAHTQAVVVAVATAVSGPANAFAYPPGFGVQQTQYRHPNIQRSPLQPTGYGRPGTAVQTGYNNQLNNNNRYPQAHAHRPQIISPPPPNVYQQPSRPQPNRGQQMIINPSLAYPPGYNINLNNNQQQKVPINRYPQLPNPQANLRPPNTYNQQQQQRYPSGHNINQKPVTNYQRPPIAQPNRGQQTAYNQNQQMFVNPYQQQQQQQHYPGPNVPRQPVVNLVTKAPQIQNPVFQPIPTQQAAKPTGPVYGKLKPGTIITPDSPRYVHIPQEPLIQPIDPR